MRVKRLIAAGAVVVVALIMPLLSGCCYRDGYAAYPDYGPYWHDPWYYHHGHYYHHHHHHQGGIRATPFRDEPRKAPSFTPSIPRPGPVPPRP